MHKNRRLCRRRALHPARRFRIFTVANAGVSVYALMNLPGDESMTRSQRYVTAGGTVTRARRPRTVCT
jgi:hypothetical protein